MENLKAKSFDLRKDTVDIIVAGKGGHIGGDMSVIDTLISLYFCQMNISPENLDDPDRDRFVLSKGHSVEAYYAVLQQKASWIWMILRLIFPNSVPNILDIRTTSFLESR